MTAMEYAGYTLKRGCGCRHGFCGACATIYRIKGENELKDLPGLPDSGTGGHVCGKHSVLPDRQDALTTSKIFSPNQQIMMELYPEIYSCIGCNACTKACTAGV